MKQILTILAVMIFASIATAQKPLATLSHNGQQTFFDNNTCFESALAKAENGDTIFLSPGKFLSNNSRVNISKRVSIVGCGYESHILPDIGITMGSNPNSYMEAPMFDGVRIQRLIFPMENDGRNNLQKVEIRRCKIAGLENAGYAGNELLIDRCWIDNATFYGASGNSTIVQNCKITAGDGTLDIVVKNCHLITRYLPRSVESSILEDYSGYSSFDTNGTHIVMNSLTHPTSNSSVVYQDCYFDENDGNSLLDENLESTVDLQAKGYLGTDGTIVGIHGGYYPFSENPSIPTVDAANSSVVYDQENNKLNVTITVAPN